MRRAKDLSPQTSTTYLCELDQCPFCHSVLAKCAYHSGIKTVQELSGVRKIAYQPKRCVNPNCADVHRAFRSSEWLHIAPLGGTYGYDVIALIGWQRQEGFQTFDACHQAVSQRVTISESQVRYMYTQQYLPLLACHERHHLQQLQDVSKTRGLVLSLDGLAPEGGEAQLWVIRELRTGLTLRSGWMSQQDQTAFEHFLHPIVDAGYQVSVVLSDKQRGLLPAIHTVFPQARHALCQSHYLKNLAEPVNTADEAMKVQLRKTIRGAIGPMLRSEHVDAPGVLTVTGVLPSGAEPSSPAAPHASPFPGSSSTSQKPGVDQEDGPLETGTTSVGQQRHEIVMAIQQRLRYLLTLKGRPPFRLAGIEMYERLTEVAACLTSMLEVQADPRLVHMHQGLADALSTVDDTYHDLRQAADWLAAISAVLDPEGAPERPGDVVREQLFASLDTIQEQGAEHPVLSDIAAHLKKTTRNYAPGLFHTYDIEDVPRTNNARESEFRGLIRQLVKTTGQRGATRRLILRSGAWEAIPHPSTMEQTREALADVAPEELHQERNRVRQHRKRFRTHTRSRKQSQQQLNDLQKHWAKLAQRDGYA